MWSESASHLLLTQSEVPPVEASLGLCNSSLMLEKEYSESTLLGFDNCGFSIFFEKIECLKSDLRCFFLETCVVAVQLVCALN